MTSSGKRTSSAFFVESMVLLVFFAASLAVVAQLMQASVERAQRSATLSRAVAAASSAAERFAADPEAVCGTEGFDGLRVVCSVDGTPDANGTLWHADIAVYDENGTSLDPVYQIETARYVQERALSSSQGVGP